MYRVYFEDKVISFTSAASPSKLCDGWVIDARTDSHTSEITPAKMLEKLENNKRVCIKSEEPKRTLEVFLSHFREVDAAGGVVESGEGATLMIFRAGRWDLPKGHVEEQEEWTEAAVREVCEETGLNEVEVERLIITTHHFYLLAGKWVMKHTHWYEMSTIDDGTELIPQTEEGISNVRWVSKQDLQECIATAFASVKEVFKAREQSNINT